jgi:hypothetical protein
MAVKLGNTTASLYLGSTPVAAYLGAEEVYSAAQAVTLYFNGAVDGDWAEVGNWWLDAEHTQAAGRLPAEIDSVVATAFITASGQTVVDFTLSDPTESAPEFNGTLTVTGLAYFEDNGVALWGTIIGNAAFSDGAANSGNVTGTATFTGSACNNGGTAGTFVPDPPPSC